MRQPDEIKCAHGGVQNYTILTIGTAPQSCATTSHTVTKMGYRSWPYLVGTVNYATIRQSLMMYLVI